MRLIGSFQTITTQGVSGDTVLSMSTSASCVVDGTVDGTEPFCPYDGGSMAVSGRPLVPSRIARRALSHGDSRPAQSFGRGLIAITKPRIIELLLVTTVPTMVLARKGWPSTMLVLVTLVGGALAAGGANALNMVIDRDIDRLMERTKHRPLVTGVVTPRQAVVFAWTLEIVAFGVLWTWANLLSAVLTFSATLFYVVIYSLWLKRTSRQNIVIGGAAGAVPVLVGWSAVNNNVSWSAAVLFLLIFLWTPPHFWALAIRHADDYRAANVPMLPVVATPAETIRSMYIYTVALVTSSLILVPVADLGPIYWVGAVVLGAGFLVGVDILRRRPTPRVSMRLFSYSISYISLLFGAMTLDVLVRYGVS